MPSNKLRNAWRYARCGRIGREIGWLLPYLALSALLLYAIAHRSELLVLGTSVMEALVTF